MDFGNVDLGDIFLNVLLDTSKIPDQLNKLQNETKINRTPIQVPVDTKQLHELNKLLDVKNRHLEETVANFKRNPLTPQVDLSQLHDLNKLLDRVGSGKAISIEATVKYKDDRSRPRDSSYSPGVMSGFQQEIGRQLVGTISSALRRNFDFDSKKSADRVADKIAAPVKLFITENPELKQAIDRTGKVVEDRLRKSGYVIGEAIVQSLDRENANIKQRIETFTNAVAPNIKQAVQTVKTDVEKVGKDLFVSTFNPANTTSITQQFEAKLRAYKEAALRDIAAPKAVDRAQEIINKGKTNNTGNVVTPDTKELIVVTGGYAGARGLSGKRLATDIRKEVPQGTEVIWVANKDSDIPKESMSAADSKAKALLTSMSKPNLRGYSNDAVEMAAQALVALQKNPDLKIKFLGESGGGDPAAEATKILQMMGVANAKYLGVGTPDFIGGHDSTGKKIISPDEYLGAETHRIYSKLGLARTGSDGANILGVTGHPYENYRDAKIAELENFLKGKPDSLSKEDIGRIKNVADSFGSIDTAGMTGKEIETLSKQAYSNLQLIRRHMVDAIGEPDKELAAIAKQFESVYVATANEPRSFTQVRASVTKAKQILDRIAEQPGIEAARVARQMNAELLQIQAEFGLLNNRYVGTLRQKYSQLDRQLQEVVDASNNPSLAIPFAARALAPAKVVIPEPPTETDLVVATNRGITIPNRVKEYAVQTLNVVATGTVNVVGKALGAAYGAETALLGKGGANTVNALAAAVGLSQLPGGQALIGGAGAAIGGLAQLPAAALAGQTSEAITQILTQVAGNVPLLKGAIPQASAAIELALQSGAVNASTTIGQLLAPFAVGAGAVKALSAGANRLPGIDSAANASIAGATKNQVARLLEMGGTGAGKLAGAGAKLIGGGADIIDAEIVEENFPRLLGGVNRMALPRANPIASNIGSIDPSDSTAIQSEVNRIKSLIQSEKKKILANLKSSDPAQVEQGLIMAGELGIGQAMLKNDLRVLVDKARGARNQLVEQNPDVAKKGNIPGYSNLLKSQQSAQAMVDDKGAATRQIIEQVQKLEQNPSLISKISPALKQGAIGTGVFASIIAALTTGAQAATVGGGAAAGGGILAALSPFLLPALGIGAVGAAGYAGYQALNPQSSKFGSINNPERMKQSIGAIPDPPDPNTDPGIVGAIKNRFSGFSRMLGSAIVGLIGFQVAQMALPIITGFLKESIGKAIGSANLNLALRATSTSDSAYRDTLATSQQLSTKLSTSELGIRESLSKFQANIMDTPLEGQGDQIISGLSKDGRLLGVDKEGLKLSSRALSQSAGKGQLYSEEIFGQLGESLPGGPTQLAAASGLSVKQLRALLKSGGADAGDMLSRLGGRLNAQADVALEGFENTPQAKLGKLEVAIEKLQLKLGEGLLAPVSTGADLASRSIDLLSDNMGILGSVGTAALLKLVVDSGIAGNALKGLSSIDWSKFSQGIGGAKNALSQLVATPVGGFLAELALLTLAVEAVKSLTDGFTGGDTPGKAIADDMEKARIAIEKTAKATKDISPELTAKSRDEYFDKNKNLFDRIKDFNVFQPLFGGEKLSTKDKLIQDVAQADRTIAEGRESYKTISSFQLPSADLEKIRTLNRELQTLKTSQSTATGLDAQELEKITTQIALKGVERTKLEQPVQNQLANLEALQKNYKSIVDNKFNQKDEAYQKRIEEANKELVAIAPQVERFKNILAETTVETSRTALALQEMNYRFGQTQLSIDRTNTEQLIKLTDGFSGSLLKGARAAAEFDLKMATLETRRAASLRFLSDAKQTLEQPEVVNQIRDLRKGGKYQLPTDLRDVTDEQLKDIEANVSNSKQTVAAIRAFRSSSGEVLKDTREIATTRDAFNVAMAEERKASKEYYFNAIAESKKIELASIESSRQIQQANLSSQFKVGLSNVSSAMGQYINTLTEIFIDLGNLTKTENERRQKDYEIEVQKMKAKIDYTNRNNASTEPAPMGAINSNVASPILGTTLDQVIRYQPKLSMQGFDATRTVPGGGTRPHGAIDYGSAMGVGLGTPVQAVIDGTATYSQNVEYGYKTGKEYKTDQVILEGNVMTDAGMQKVKFQYFHLGRDSAKYFKDGFTKNVKAGELLGVVGADGKIGGNEYHLHFATWLNGRKTDPSKMLEMLRGGGRSASGSMPSANGTAPIILSAGHFGDRDTGEGLNKGLGNLSVVGNNGQQRNYSVGAEAIANYVVATRAMKAAKEAGLDVRLGLPDSQATGKAGDEIRNSYYKTLRQQASSNGSNVVEIHFDDRNSGKPGYIAGKGDDTSLDRAFGANYGYYGNNPKFGFPKAEGGTNRFTTGFAATNNGIDLIEIDKLSTNSEYGKAVADYIKASQDGDTKKAAAIYKQLEDLADRLYVPKLVKTLIQGTGKIKAEGNKPVSAPIATSQSAFTPVTATVYFPGEKNTKVEGGRSDIYGKYIDRHSKVVATRTTDITGLGLPYGSIVELRNPANQKTTQLTVKDRGSLQPGVDIDITPAATDALGLPADGRNKLEMRVISTPKPVSKYNLGSGKGKYKVENYKVSYVGSLGQDISIAGGALARQAQGTQLSQSFAPIKPYSGNMPQPIKYAQPGVYSDTPGAINDPTKGSQFPSFESIRKNNDKAFEVQMESLERQRKANQENSDRIYATTIFEANAKRRKADFALMKGKRDEELAKVREQRELEDSRENLGYTDNPEDKLRVQAIKVRREKFDRLERAQFELKTIAEEVKGFKETLDTAKKTDRPVRSEQELQQLDDLISRIPAAIKDREGRSKWLNTYIKDTDAFYDRYEADIVKKYNVNKIESLSQSRRETTASSVKVTQQDIQKIIEFQKKNPFDLSMGDPLRLQSVIDTQQARMEYERVDTELTKKARESVNLKDFDRQAEIQKQQSNNRSEYLKKITNIENKLKEDILDRANKYRDYIVTQSLDLSAKELETLQSSLSTYNENERLAPTFADVAKIKESAIERQKEDDTNTKNKQAITNKYNADRNAAAKVLFDKESKLEQQRHEQTVAGINYRLRNAIVETNIARRQDELDRARTLSESSSGVRSATGNVLSAEGKSYLARLSGGEGERANLQLSLAAELKAIEDFRLKNPNLGEQADFRAKNAQEKYDKAIEAQSTQLRRDRENNLLSLRQQVGSGQVEQMGAYSDRFGARGDIYGKETIDKQIAIQQLALARTSKLKELDDLALANDGDDKAVTAIRQLREEFEELNKVKLDNIERQFSRFKGILDEATAAGGNLIGKALVGQAGEQDWLNMLSAPFKGITDAASKFLSSEYSKIINNLLGDVVKGMDKQFGNLGNGGNNQSSLVTAGAAGIAGLFNGKSRGIDSGSLNAPFGGIFGNNPPAAKQSNGWGDTFGAIFPIFRGLLGFESGGVILPHEPEGHGDKTLIRVNANESVMVPGFTRAMGGERGIDYLNKIYANSKGFESGGVPLPLPSITSDLPNLPDLNRTTPDLGMPSSTSAEPLKFEYTKIGDRDFIDREHLEARLKEQDRRQQTRLTEYNRQKDDMTQHSVAYRRKMGYGR